MADETKRGEPPDWFKQIYTRIWRETELRKAGVPDELVPVALQAGDEGVSEDEVIRRMQAKSTEVYQAAHPPVSGAVSESEAQAQMRLAAAPEVAARPDCPAAVRRHGLVRDQHRQLRMGWDQYFMAICETVALRSIDMETQNGAVIVDARRHIVSTGYNGFPAGVDDEFWPNNRSEKQNVPHVSVARPMHGDMHEMVPKLARELDSKYLEEEKFYTVDKYDAMAHAEENAIVSSRSDLAGCTIYTPLFPCKQCAKLIITSGIVRVVYTVTREHKDWAVAKELLLQAKVKLDGPAKPEG